ncbi:putative protein phosphatase 2A, regulatory B subunit, B56, armadillo-like helical [Helianthus annuus]|nr:putative protein phosphatase 2A, regulatory B subunit, B56, armadillo-like helical [Helianthus annuus]
MSLFIGKLSLCCMVFDFTDPSTNAAEKDLKRLTLIELLDFVASGLLDSLSLQYYLFVKCVLLIYLECPPPPPSNYRSARCSNGGENEDDEPSFDPAWPHLQLVYDILLKFVTSASVEAKDAKKYINHSFILRMLDLFELIMRNLIQKMIVLPEEELILDRFWRVWCFFGS